MHFGLAPQLVDIALELALIGANRPAKALVVVKDSAKAERKNRGVLKTIGNDPGVIDAGFLVEGLLGVVLADDHSEIAGWVKKNLVTTDSNDRLHGNRFTMMGQFRKSLFLTNAVCVPCHEKTLRPRALVSAAC
jgi:hypothetical protein